MHSTRHEKPVLITANVVIRATTAAVKQWPHCETIKGEAEPLVCLDDLTGRVRGSGFDTELLATAGPGSS